MAERYVDFTGWGKYVPSRVITNADLERRLDTSDEWIVTRTGIRERRIVGEGETTSQMSVAAARDALAMAELAPEDLDLIIIATSSPDYLTPPVSAQVQHALGAKRAAAFSLVAGCAGFVYAVVTAQQFLKTGVYRNALVVGAEIISRFVDWEDRSTCVLFGDGAGAVVMEATEEPAGVLSFVLGADGSGADFLIVPAGGSAMPPTHETVERGLHKIQMHGREVFKFATRVLGQALNQAIADAGLTTEDVDLFLPHQANVRIIESAARQVGLPRDRIYVNIDRYGNTSAASIPIALCEAAERGKVRPGSTLALVAFGAGLSWGAAVVRLGTRHGRRWDAVEASGERVAAQASQR